MQQNCALSYCYCYFVWSFAGSTALRELCNAAAVLALSHLLGYLRHFPERVDVYFLTSRHPCLGLCMHMPHPCLNSVLQFALHCSAMKLMSVLGTEIPQHSSMQSVLYTDYIKPFHLNRARHMHTYICFFSGYRLFQPAEHCCFCSTITCTSVHSNLPSIGRATY